MRLIAAAVLLTLATPAAAEVTYFYDEYMFEQDYSTQVFAKDGYTTTTAHFTDYSAGAGNRVFRLTYSKQGANPGGGVDLLLLNNAFTYDPGTQGAITSIDTALSQRFSINYAGQTVSVPPEHYALRLVAKQGDNYYSTQTPLSESAQHGVYRYTGVNGLVASDFRLIDLENPFAARTGTGLDFASGPISFGFELLSLGVVINGGQPATGLTNFAYYADNFSVVVRSDPVAPVPEPGEWAMIAAGLAIVSATARRRIRKA